MNENSQQEMESAEDIVLDMGHSTLIVSGSPSPDACTAFVRIMSEMKAKQNDKLRRA